METPLQIAAKNMQYSLKGPFSLRKHFPQKESFIKCDWPTQIFRRKKF
jgi:hypothetical protein